MTTTPPPTPSSASTPAGDPADVPATLTAGDPADSRADSPAADTAAGDLPQHLALVCSQFSRLAARRSEVGVGTVSWRVVATIERYGPLRLSEIADRERVSRPTATAVIKRLEEEGLVRREADPDDSRSSLVSTTAQGSAQLVAWREQLAVGVGGLLEQLPAEDHAVLERAAGILSALVDAHDS
ncbi:MarR family winged helix-turn-helix transcriptional regulator [Brachybacterium sp. AOP43-C2-M15]|uniref:MarR family winged helix-turn-helix transcriptional regulator n=1 Tax=Brachybacterium sp. AOP43-C2-M15 TaxID=3457661 RepID=UPI004034B688